MGPKKIISFVLILLVGATASVLIFFAINLKSTKDVFLHQPEKTTAVYFQQNGSQLLVEKQGDAWLETNKQIKTRKMETFLGALSRLSVYAPVPKSKIGAYNNQLDSVGVTIKVERGLRPQYRVVLSEIDGAYVLKNLRGGELYIVEIRELPDVNLAAYYTFKPDWYNLYLFSQPETSIQKISIQYHQNNKGWEISYNENVQLRSKGKRISAIDSVEALHYRVFYTPVSYIQFNSDTAGCRLKPYFTMQVDYQQVAQYIEAFQLRPSHGWYNQKFLALLNGDEWIVLNHLDFDALLVSGDYFLKIGNE